MVELYNGKGWSLRETNKQRITHYWFNNFFNDEEIDNLQTIVDTNNTFKDGEVFANSDTEIVTNKSVRRSNITFLDDYSKYEYFYRKIVDQICFVNSTIYNYSLTYIEDLQYTTYYAENSGTYDWHTDDIIGGLQPKDIRKLSFSILLSEPGVDFEGGEFEFSVENRNKTAVDELRKGTILFFPSPMLHRVKPVTKGIRKSLVGWIHGPGWS